MRSLWSGVIVLVCWASMAFAAPAADSTAAVNDARRLVQQVVDAYGGRAALEQVKAYRMDGRIVAGMQGREGPMSRLFQRPGRLRIELRYTDGTETRIVNAERGWRGVGGDVNAVTGPMLGAMVLQAARADLPLFLLTHLDSVRAVDPLERDSLRLEGVEVACGAGRQMRAYIDPVTHHILVSHSRLVTGGRSTLFQTEYSDFRKVGSVVFAFHEENFASGMATGTTTVERVTLNPRLRPTDFGAPAAKGREI